MPRGVDPEAGLSEMAALWMAETAEDMHRVLLLYPPVRQTSDAHEPMALLQAHDEKDPAASAATALLLLTDRRWRGGIGHLVRRIAESGILDAEELDFFAETFLAADEAVFWPVPDDWFSREAISISHDPAEEVGVVGEEEDDQGETSGPLVVRREVWSPLRRWAAAHLIEREPGRWKELLARAHELKASQAAAVVGGMVDGIDGLDPDAQAELIERALAWPQQAVRRQALGLVAEREGPDRAYALAESDPSRQVRSWAESLRRSAEADSTLKRARRGDVRKDQESLF